MRFTEAALLLLILSGMTGLVSVMSSSGHPPEREEALSESPDPLESLERDFAAVCFGDRFRTGYSAAGDTLVRSMDVLSSVPLQVANLHITRALRQHGFSHEVTLRVPDLGLSFICTTPDGRPARFELWNAER